VDKILAENIGRGARHARIKHGLTQEQTAELLDISTEFYARMERGHALPSVNTLARMSERLDVHADVLLHGTDEEQDVALIATDIPADPPQLQTLIRRLRAAPRYQQRIVWRLLVEFRKAGY